METNQEFLLLYTAKKKECKYIVEKIIFQKNKKMQEFFFL
jgi:hypothetical protein